VDGAQISTIVVALIGSGSGLWVLINNLIARANGKTEQIRATNADMKTQRDDAYKLAASERERATSEQKRADSEAQARNRWADHAARLRRMLVAAPCVDVADIPASPRNEE
jgi:hypothetical protein